MIYYTLLGLCWVMFLDYTVRKQEAPPFNNLTRLLNLLIWPLGFGVFILRVVRSLRRGEDEDL